MTKIKLWISDIDGTLLNYDGTCTKEMQDVIKRVNLTDTKLVLATGRMYMGAYYQARKFNLKTPIVCYQGAVVRDGDKVLWQSLVNNDKVKEITEYLRKNKIHTHIYNDDILYVEDDNKRIMEQYCSGRGTTYEVLNSFDEINLTNVAKVLAVIEDPYVMQKTKLELSEKYKGILSIVQSAKAYLEITNINASKGNALNFLKEYWGLSNDEIIASGDQDNDIDMIKNAGIGVCVGDNSEELKKASDYYCKSVNSNELTEIIKRLILCE